MKHSKKYWNNFSCFVEPAILAYSDHNKEFILHVDASGKRKGAVLLQYQEGDLRVISYGSRTLTQAEKKYHSSNLNFWDSNGLHVTNLEITYIMHHTSTFTQKITLLPLTFVDEGNNCFYDFQFGFRLNFSTNTALMSVIESIQNKQDQGKYAAGVLLTLKMILTQWIMII